jgi:hypothetical protein
MIDQTEFKDQTEKCTLRPHHFYAAPAPGNKFDAAPALAPTVLTY